MSQASQQSANEGLLTRVSLLQRAREDENHPAWEELLSYYEPFVSKVLLSMSFRGADLEDAKQQVFLKLWRGLHTYERDPERALFRTWFARLIRNTALNIIRSRNRQPTGPSFDDEQSQQANMLSDDSGLEKRVEEEWQQYVVELAMDRARLVFSGHAIEVFTMSLDGQTVEHIAETLGIKTNTVYILKHRVKTVLLREIQQLKKDLEELGENSTD
ncbi:MAG: RNA polymerase sigma factor [Roseibacillus sp.]